MSIAAYVIALLSWAALHLAWQGAAVGLLFMLWLRKSTPSATARYSAAVAGLAVMPIALVTNLIVAHLALRENARLGAVGALVAEAPVTLGTLVMQIDRRFDVLTALAVLWMSGAAVLAMRLLVDAVRVSSLGSSLAPAPRNVSERVLALSTQMGLSAPPVVLLSPAATTPFITGRAPGTLVLPSESAPGEELDALILHELAHVRRGDVAVNAVLRLSHALLWFHPVTWYLAAEADRAREESCDVEAVSHTRALVLAAALVRLEERRHHRGARLAANGGMLSVRVRALVSGRAVAADTPPRWMRVAVLGSAVFLAGVITSGRLAPSSDALAVLAVRANAVASQRTDIAAEDPAGRFSLALLNGRVAEATIAGVPVARPAIERRLDRVALRSAKGDEVLALQLDPRGSIHWLPRFAAAHRSD